MSSAAEPAGDAALWRLRIEVPAAAVAAFEAALAGTASACATFALADDARWQIELLLPGRPDSGLWQARVAVTAAALDLAPPAIDMAPVAGDGWVERVLDAVRPVRAGRFFVHGSHRAERPPPGAIPIVIDAATAFGTGEHASTRGCLLMIDRLARRRSVRSALDMGCGSGLLAIAMARAWRCSVRAVDIDRRAVAVARGNARRNGVGRWVRCVAADGYGHRCVGEAAPFDLVTANILARPLAAMAPGLGRRLAPGGAAIVAGLLRRQVAQVLAPHRHQGLALAARLDLGDWTTLLLRRR